MARQAYGAQGQVLRRVISMDAVAISAIKDGRKIETRRPVNVPPSYQFVGKTSSGFSFAHKDHPGNRVTLPAPYGAAGKVVGIGETVRRGIYGFVMYPADNTLKRVKWRWKRKALLPRCIPDDLVRFHWKLGPTLVERLHDITEEGAQREGFESVAAFKEHWDRIYLGTDNEWARNPLVWVVSDDQE